MEKVGLCGVCVDNRDGGCCGGEGIVTCTCGEVVTRNDSYAVILLATKLAERTEAEAGVG